MLQRTSYKPKLWSLAIAAMTLACQDHARESAVASSAAARDTVRQLRTSMMAVEDSLGRLLREMEVGDSALQQVDSARASLQVEVQRMGAVSERLSSSAPDVYARLGSFVTEHRRMRARLATLDDSVAVLHRRIQSLEGRNSALRRQVAALRAENRELREVVARLVTDSVERARRLATLDSSRTAILEKSSRAYVAIAPRDSLARLGIAGKTNFLRLGATVVKRFDREVFRAIDTRRDTLFAIWVPARDATVLSTHPSGSFVLQDAGPTSTLRILDVDAFWSISRTLAVMTSR